MTNQLTIDPPVSKWQDGNPTKPGLWWLKRPIDYEPWLYVQTQKELDHTGYGFPKGSKCLYAGPLPVIPLPPNPATDAEIAAAARQAFGHPDETVDQQAYTLLKTLVRR